MNLKAAFSVFSLVAMLTILTATTADCDRTMYLGVCQELVSGARSYEARATFHNNVAKAFQIQIESLSKLPKNQGTISAMDSLFSQYDQNRMLEGKFRSLFRQASDDADRCMKSAE